jgi:fatty acid synthase, animal type
MVVLVTGFSGRFPSSSNVTEFWKNLCDGVDLVTENSSRYPLGYSDLPGRQAQIPNIEKFDALFFGISSAQASCLDPQIRLLLESVYEAILDAGYTMEDLAKSNTGVYVGGCFSDMHKALLKDVRTITGYENTGCSHSMFANRVSFCFDFIGPSMTIDTACSSSLVALDVAARDIRSGKISRAIVAGVSIAIDPGLSLSLAPLPHSLLSQVSQKVSHPMECFPPTASVIRLMIWPMAMSVLMASVLSSLKLSQLHVMVAL